MEQAIKLAIEGGWGGKLKPNVVIEKLENECIGFHYPDKYDGVSMSVYDILMQPIFWQALGKSLGWDEGEIDDKTYGDGKYSQDWMWIHKWHSFIDHIAEGKDKEEFFKELLK